MNWASGFSAEYRAFKVDPGTWADGEEIPFISGTIDRDMDTELLESASFSVRGASSEQWIRVYLIARQGGEAEKVPVFTGIASAPSREVIGDREEYSLDCYSVLKVADDILLPLGYYAAAGMQGGRLIKTLLSDLPCNVSVQDASPSLENNIVAGYSDSKLRMARQVADAINWRIRIDGRGDVYVEPWPDTVAAVFDANETDVIEPKVTDSHDLFSIPNVLRVTMDGATATARDDAQGSDYSTVGRGREIWMSENISSLADNETIAAYAVRRLKELQAPARTLTYTRRFHPDVVPGSLVNISYPRQELAGTFRIQNQSISLGFNASTQEEAIYEA